jgi:predicted MFS family arabinose efflux permease
LLVFRYLEKRIQRRLPSVQVPYGVMRPVIFLFLFGIDLSAALIPLQMERLYEPILNLPKDVVLGLPVSAMFLMVGVTFIIAGAWMDRRGWHEPFVVGVLLTGISKFYAWLAPDAFQFVLAMAGIGFGYGLALMAAQGFVMANTSDKEKAHGISYFFAGVYAGSIGGTAIGAMLAERLGYDLVFLVGSLFIFVCFACGIFFLRSTFVRPVPTTHQVDQSDEGKSSVLSFLLNRNVLTLILFCSIPSAVAVIGFLNYFSPVYLSRLGVSESIIGGVLTLYGISMVYISPIIGAKIDRTERKDVFIVVGCVLCGCAFLGFHVLTGLPATILAVILLGLSMSCLQASQTTYTLKLKATKRFGDGKAVAIVRASSRVGQMLGPMVFSGLVIAEDTEHALTMFGLGYLFLAILFMALSRREHPDVIPEDEERVLASPGEAKA